MMVIQALPQTTVQALGASQVLPDPAALVKELVDNALDAKATSIVVEIHSNTLDIITVRDNGHGIAPEGRLLAARRYCTSKILCSDDLESIGGRSLGFRGEALASAAELSREMAITTRTEGEHVATVLKVNPQGEVIGQDRTFLPVGTFVRISDFLKANPVRRQVVLKNAENYLKRIKRTLQAYAFARPRVRWSLRVLKAKDTRLDWVYAPKLNGSPHDAALKIVGTACASQCMWSTFDNRGYTFQGLLPHPDADPSKISNIGSFLSVDQRPVSSSHGIFKSLIKIYCEALKRQSSVFADVKSPFLHLQIGCPEGSYDINIEPAKDDVLFEDPSSILNAVEELFEAHYTRPRISIGNNVDSATDLSSLLANRREPSDLSIALKMSAMPARNPTLSKNERLQASIEAGYDLGFHDDCLETFRSLTESHNEEGVDLLDRDLSNDYTRANCKERHCPGKDWLGSNSWGFVPPNSGDRLSSSDQIHLLAKQQTNGETLDSSSKREGQAFDTGVSALPTPRPSSPLRAREDSHRPVTMTKIPNTQEDMLIKQSNATSPQVNVTLPLGHEGVLNRNAAMGAAPFPAKTSDPPLAPRDVFTRIPSSSISNDGRYIYCSNTGPRVSKVKRRVKKGLRNLPQSEKVWFDNPENVDQQRQSKMRRIRQHVGYSVPQDEVCAVDKNSYSMKPLERNRDIRDFIGPGASQTMDNIASKIKDRNDITSAYETSESGAPVSHQIEHSGTRRSLMLAKCGSIPITKIAALDRYASSPEKHKSRTTMRPETSEHRVLQVLNASTPNTVQEVRDGYMSRPERGSCARPPRTPPTKVNRAKSATFLLERTSAEQSVQNIVYHAIVSSKDLTINDYRSLLGFNKTVLETFSQFPPVDLLTLTNELHDLLTTLGSDSDADQGSLFRELSAAFARCGMAAGSVEAALI